MFDMADIAVVVNHICAYQLCVFKREVKLMFEVIHSPFGAKAP
jgi:hypothetical protein